MNVSLPTKEQWKKIGTAALFSFVSGFIGTFVAQGGIQIGIQWEGVISLLGACLMSAINTTVYFLWVTFFKKAE